MALGRIALATVKGITYEVEQELTATMTLSLTNCIANGLESLVAYGGAEQASTPTPASPVDIVCNNGTLKYETYGLPNTYTPLEYIEAQSDCRIDTGLTGDTTITIVAQATSVPASTTQILVSDSNAGAGGTWFGARTSGYWSLGPSHETSTACTTKATSVVTLSSTNISITINGETFTRSVSSGTSLGNISLFSTNTGTYNFYGKVWSAVIEQNGSVVMNLVPAKRNSDSVAGMYDTISDTFFTSATANSFVAGTELSPYVYADGTTETIEDELGNTATCENLLSVGDYTDEQEILTGEITRKVGIKVLDGTESWSTGNNVYLMAVSGRKTEKSTVLCSHFVYSSGTSSTAPDLSIISFLSANIGIRYDAKTSVSDFTDWLADEYANGTPVIIVYPLATETTETATAQTMNIQSGTNTIEITQASLNDLELYAKWKATS